MVEAVAKKQDFLEPLPSQVLKARQDLRQVLKKQIPDKQNRNIYDHVVEVVDRIVQSCPDRAIERFEEISYLIRNKDTLALEEFVRCNDDRSYARFDAEMAEGTKGGIASLKQLFGGAPEAGAADGGDPEDGGAAGPTLGLVQDLTSLNRHVFNAAGIELGEYGSLILQKALKKLAATSEAKSLRFWGKINGTVRDYYIVEAFEPKNLPEDTRPEGGEARGIGVNEYTYYVSN